MTLTSLHKIKLFMYWIPKYLQKIQTSYQDVIVVDIEDPKDEKKIENSLKTLFPDHMFTSSSSSVPGINGKLSMCQ